MLTHLQAIYRRVAEYLTTAGPSALDVVQVNAKGDKTKAFDYNTEALILAYLEKEFPAPVRVLTEERGELVFGSREPEYTVIVDPVDGSDNFARGLGMTSFSIAVLPAGAPLTIDHVQYGLVGHIYLHKLFTAEKGRGAYCNGEKLTASPETDLTQAALTGYFVSKEPRDCERAARLLRRVSSLRCFGTAAYEIAQVAAGGLDAYVDVRQRCTPENFMAAAMMVQEAGGVVSDERGAPLRPIPRLSYGYDVIISGNQRLHDAIVAQFA